MLAPAAKEVAGLPQAADSAVAAVGAAEVVEAAEGHLCCGSAGTYNLLQPEIAGRLRARKLDNIARTAPDVIAAVIGALKAAP